MACQLTDCGTYITEHTLYVGNNSYIRDASWADTGEDKAENKGEDKGNGGKGAVTPLVLKVFRTVRGAKVEDVPELQHIKALPPHPNVLAPAATTTFRGFPAALFPRYPSDLFDVVVARWQDGMPCPPSMAMCRHVFVQIARALKHCHDHGMAHLDIKLENVFVDFDDADRTYGTDETDDADRWWAMRIVLGDFEFAVPVGTACSRSVGTNGYQAPEMLALRERPRADTVAPAPCDVWSLGILLCVMATGKQLSFVPGETIKYVLKQARANGCGSGDCAHALNAELESLQDLLQGMLQCNPVHRLTIDRVLLHAWTAGATAR